MTAAAKFWPWKHDRKTWVYRCWPDCARQVETWARRQPGITVRLVSGREWWMTVILKGPADADFPENKGIVAEWGYTAPWQVGLPVGYQNLPPEVEDRLLAENEQARARWVTR